LGEAAATVEKPTCAACPVVAGDHFLSSNIKKQQNFCRSKKNNLIINLS
jgi:hypothetical protein